MVPIHQTQINDRYDMHYGSVKEWLHLRGQTT